jgi:hypothetical protein
MPDIGSECRRWVVLAFRAVEDGAHYEAMPEVTTGPNGS